jgi:Na+/melibiose symporter-like transporter
MIITCKKKIPLHWTIFAIMPWAAFSFKGAVLGAGFLFSLKKFVENPAGLTFVLSLPSFFAIVLQPVVSFLSDRIWTRFGRRKPFVCTSFFGITVSMILMPLMPNFWALLVVYMLYQIFADLNSPMEPLKQEIIPPAERGRATAAMSWFSNLATMTFWFVALGRFDDVSYMGSLAIQGETVIYWTGGLMMLMMGLLVTLGIREVDQKSPLRGQRLTPATFFGGLLDRELWPVYMLIVGSACMNFYAGLGALSNLLYTEQWAYTKQEMGINVAVGGVINIFVIAALAIFSNRLNRMRAYQTLICLSLIGQICYYCYVEFVLPDKHPSLIEIIVFGEVLSILGILTGMVYVPLVYDYVRRNKMGTYNAGAQLVTRLTVLITLNGVGLFVWGYATFFQPPAGEMTRVVLQGGDENREADVLRILRAASWSYPQDGSPVPSDNIAASAWQANGTFADTGRGWEIRLRNKDSVRLAEEKEKLTKARLPLVSDEKIQIDKVASLMMEGRTGPASEAEKKVAAYRAEIVPIDARIKEIDRELENRAQAFCAHVEKILGGRLIVEGDQIIAARVQPAIVFELTTALRPDVHALERSLEDIRRERPELIDIRPLKLTEGYGIAVSATLGGGMDATALTSDLHATVDRLFSRHQPGLFSSGTVPGNLVRQQALSLDLMVVEAPLDTYVSPITRVINVGLAWFDRVPPPERRLSAIARNLRVSADTNHVRANAGLAPKTIRVIAVMPREPSALTESNGPVSRRIGALLDDPLSTEWIPWADEFYQRIEKAAASQKITVAHPVLSTGYATMKYDYMSGYLWMFVMSLAGIGITIAFCRFEKKGLVRKYGLEEAQSS